MTICDHCLGKFSISKRGYELDLSCKLEHDELCDEERLLISLAQFCSEKCFDLHNAKHHYAIDIK